MLFWVKTVAIFLAAALGSFALAVVLSFLSVLPLARDDSPGLGILWGLIFLAEAAMLIPLCLALTAELIERRAQERAFSWIRTLSRFGMALILGAGPLYTCLYVLGTIESFRPHHYIATEVTLYCLSALFGALALRIKRRPATN